MDICYRRNVYACHRVVSYTRLFSASSRFRIRIARASAVVSSTGPSTSARAINRRDKGSADIFDTAYAENPGSDPRALVANSNTKDTRCRGGPMAELVLNTTHHENTPIDMAFFRQWIMWPWCPCWQLEGVLKVSKDTSHEYLHRTCQPQPLRASLHLTASLTSRSHATQMFVDTR